MMKKQPSHAISGVFVFLLLGIFAVFSTVMVLLGARAYQGTVNRTAAHNADRIAPAYIRSMVRAQDEQASLRIDTVEGMPVITLESGDEEETYLTRIYAWNGQLREWYSSADYAFVPENGEPVCALDELTAAVEGGLLRLGLRRGAQWTQVDIALRAAAEVRP